MQQHGYKDLAKIYDLVNLRKNYQSETFFLKKIFEKYHVKTVLDVGCGTGTHINLLEKAGYECAGIDINQEMLEVAKHKIKGKLTCSDMTQFDLGKKYDAVICMFAAFNHLLSLEQANNALQSFKKHLKPNSILLLDLHNPQNNGQKTDIFDEVERTMKWDYNPTTKIEK